MDLSSDGTQVNTNVSDTVASGSLKSSGSSRESSASIESAMDRNPQFRFLLGVLKVS